MGEGDDVEELAEELGIVEISFDDVYLVLGEELLPRAFEGRVVVGVEVVKAEDAIAALLEGEGAVRADETGGAGDEDGEAVGAAGGGGFADLLLPGGAAAVEGGREEAVGGVEVVGVGGGGGGEGRVVKGEEED